MLAIKLTIDAHILCSPLSNVACQYRQPCDFIWEFELNSLTGGEVFAGSCFRIWHKAVEGKSILQ